MRKIVLVVVLLAFLASPCFTMSMSWDNWVLSNWTPDWSYNGGWVKPNPAAFGFSRQTFSGPSDPQYIVRYAHYKFNSVQNPGLSFLCGPETYLNSSMMCSRNPLYWNVAAVGGFCQPDTLVYGSRNTCESSGSNNCCYKTVGGDLVSIARLATVYPPGS